MLLNYNMSKIFFKLVLHLNINMNNRRAGRCQEEITARAHIVGATRHIVLSARCAAINNAGNWQACSAIMTVFKPEPRYVAAYMSIIFDTCR